MNWLRVTMLRLRGVFASPRREGELDEELRTHLEMLVEENVERGMTPEDALRAARLSLGGPEQIKEAVREQRGLPFVESFAQDLRFGLRMLRKNPGFTAIAILTLALGIGANTAIFSVVNGILLEPLPYANSSRLFAIGTLRRSHGTPIGRQGISLLQIADIQSQTTAFERMAVYQQYMGARIRTDLMPDAVDTSQISADFFPLLAGRPIIGRPILPEDEKDGGKKVAVLSFRMWQQDFGGDANVLSRSFLVDDKPYQVVGVMPREFMFGLNDPNGKGFWTPLLPDPRFVGRRDFTAYIAVGLLKKNVTLEQAAAQLRTLSGRLAVAYPKTDKNLDLIATSVKGEMVERVRAGLMVLFGAVGFVLLIACVNVSALLVSRAWTRQREIAIRKALGATRMRLVRQLLSESAVLSFAGGALGLLASVWGVRLLRSIAPPYTPRIEQIRIDANVLWFALGISIVAAMLFGMAPALQASADKMRGEGLGGSFARGITPRRRVLRGALLATEVSLALILVLGAALMLESFEKLIHVDTGLRTDHVLSMHVNSTDEVCGYKSPEEQCEAAKKEILQGIRSLPGVQMAAISQGYALLGGGYAVNGLYVEGSPDDLMVAQAAKIGPFLDYHSITSDYFDILGIRVLAGRKFNDQDSADSPPVAIVSKSFAEMFLPADPLGKRFAISKDKDRNPKWMQVVGVVSDDRDTRPQLDPAPLCYLPASQHGYYNVSDYLVRTSEDPMALAPAVEKQIWFVDKDAPIRNVRTMDQSVEILIAEPKFETWLLVSFGVIGLLLSIVGVYGVMSYAVVQRTHEIGVRMALGAKTENVMMLVVWDGLRLAGIGVISGLVVSWGLTRFLRSLLFEMAPTDARTFAAVAVVLMGVALAACWIPARRATKVDPMVALRYE